jgi:hypothetical protein
MIKKANAYYSNNAVGNTPGVGVLAIQRGGLTDKLVGVAQSAIQMHHSHARLLAVALL